MAIGQDPDLPGNALDWARYWEIWLSAFAPKVPLQQRVTGLRRSDQINCYSMKTLTYSIERRDAYGNPRYVGGFADRIKGVCFAFAIALLTGRRFYIDWARPCPLEAMLPPREYDWRIDHVQRSRINEAMAIFDWIDDGFTPTLTAKLASPPGEIDHEIFAEASDVVIYVNSIPFQALAKQSQALDSLGFDCRSPMHLLSSAFDKLFSTSAVKANPAWARFQLFRQSAPVVLGGQFRTGAGNPWQDPALDVVDNSELFADSLLRYARRHHIDEFGIFATSDSEVALSRIVAAIPSGIEVLVFSGPRVHLDRSPDDLVRTHASQVALEFIALGECDHIVIGAGEFGLTAAYRGGKCPVHYAKIRAD